MRFFIVGGLCVALSACASAYKSEGISSGFSETQIDTNIWRITFTGNGYTKRHHAEDFALLCSAECFRVGRPS